MSEIYSINHRQLFLLGWIYYMLTPIIMGYSGVFEGVESLSMMLSYFDAENTAFLYLTAYHLLALAMYFAGSYWRSLIRFNAHQGWKAGQRSRVGLMLLFVYTLLLFLFALEARSLIGSGYIDIEDLSAVGPLATLQMIVLFQYLYERSSGHKISKCFGWLLAVNSLILLSTGGRLYVLATLISCYVRWWNWEAPSRAAQLRALFIPLGVLIGLIGLGMWRVGDSNNSLVGFYLVAESVFTSISAMSLFSAESWSLLPGIPLDFFSSFANLVPSLIWQDKAEWLAALMIENKNYDSPFGAVSITASTVSNFGFLAGLLFFLGIGAYMTSISRACVSAPREAYFCYLMGLLPFMFFRDPFQVQIKVVVTGYILFWLANVRIHRQGKSNKFAGDA
jgi:hypothetical protein